MLKPYVEPIPGSKIQPPKPKTQDKIPEKIVELDEGAESSENESDDLGLCAAVMGLVESSDVEDLEEEEGNTGIRLEEENGNIVYPNTVETDTWKEVKINPELSEADQDRLRKLVEEYSDIFSDVPTPTNLIEFDIKLPEDEPFYTKPYRIPVHLVDKVEDELQKMLQMGWIERADSDYASGLVIVKKKGSDDLRLCVNYKKLEFSHSGGPSTPTRY
jgi:hypothetical protein